MSLFDDLEPAKPKPKPLPRKGSLFAELKTISGRRRPATLATPATHRPEKHPTVATVATVATPSEPEPTPIASVDELRAEAGEDWNYIVAEPDRLAAFVRLVAITKAREEDRRPDHYTATTVCASCGPVPIWEGAPENVEGCPWCHGSR